MEKILGSRNILAANKKHIEGFIEDQSIQGNSEARQIKYLSIIGRIAEMIDSDFKKAEKQDIKTLVGKINKLKLADWTKHDYLLTVKVFYKFLRDTEEYPPEVKWIKPQKARNHKKLPRDLITIEDAKALAECTKNPRDRCLVLLLYESGARISELIELKIRDLVFDEYGARITLPDNGKTGARVIRVIASAPAISNWLRHHPRRNEKGAPLLCGIWKLNRGKTLGYRTPYDVLKELGVRTGIDKPMNPHHFRHSRATELAKKLTEAQLCEYMGWVIGSREAATYVHLSGRDMDEAILEMYGIKTEKTKETAFKPIDCPRCGIKNDAASKFCRGCSLGLDEKSIMAYDREKDIALKTGFSVQELLKDSNVVDIIGDIVIQKLKEQKG